MHKTLKWFGVTIAVIVAIPLISYVGVHTIGPGGDCYGAPEGGMTYARQGDLLSYTTTIDLKSVDRFVASEVFKKDAVIGEHTVGWIPEEFAEHFLNTIEVDVPATTVKVHTLRHNTCDPAIVHALGTENAEMPLAHVHQLIQVTDVKRVNIAYVRSSIDGKIWAVMWGRYVGGNGKILVSASPIDDRHGWHASYRVYSK